MKLREEDLKKAYRASLQEEAAGKLCPSTETLLNAFSAGLNEEEKIKIVDHVSECRLCLNKFKMIKEIMEGSKTLAVEWEGVALTEAETALLKQRAKEKIRELKEEHKKEEKEKSGGKRRTFLFKYWPVPLVVGTGIIIIAAFLIFKFPPSRKEDIIRGREGKVIEFITPRGQIERLPIVFEWKALLGVKEYQVVLMDAELDVLWVSGRIGETRVELPFELGKTIQQGKPYYWKVLISKESGEIEESDLQKFKLEKLK